MRQLRTCDFCGDDAVGTFEIVPPELTPTEAEQRRVVLCADCQPTLEELLEPLLARAGAEPATKTESAESATDEARSVERTDRRSGETAASPGVLGGDGDSDGASPDEPDRNGEIGSETDRDDQVATNPPSARENDGDGNDNGTASRGTPGIETETGGDGPNEVLAAGESERSTVDEGVAIQPGDRTGDAATDSPGTATGEPDEEPPTATPAQAGKSNATSAPKAYGKVLRLLQNREFPMARADVEALAAGAYDLEDYEVESIVDHAVEQGELVEDGRNVRLG